MQDEWQVITYDRIFEIINEAVLEISQQRESSQWDCQFERGFLEQK